MSKHQRFYRPELDVLRALAFLLVFLHHTAFQLPSWLETFRNAGAFGVCLFFLLSAFLITELLEREFQSTGTVRLRAFYARRVLRIWPLYFAILLLDFLFQHARHPGTFTGIHLAAFLLLAGNWFVAKHGFLWTWSMPLWSISVEEQFYLICPSIRRLAGRSGLFLFCGVSFAASYLALLLLCRWKADVDTTVWVNSFVHFQFFASGVLLALSLKGRLPSCKPWQRGSLVSAGLGALYAGQGVFHVKFNTGPPQAQLLLPGYALVNAGCIALLLGFLGTDSFRRAKPLIYLGKISYGLYAFHYGVLLTSPYLILALTHLVHPLRPFAPGLTDTCALALTIAVASLSYRYFEKPILRFKQRFEVVRTRPA